MKNSKTLLSSIPILLVMSFFIFLPSLAQAQGGTVTLGAGDGAGLPGSTNNPVEISLDNLDTEARGIQFDICRGDDLVLPEDECGTTDRTQGFSCKNRELQNGCDRVILIGIGAFIAEGTGPVITLPYDVAPGAQQGVCQDFTLKNVIVEAVVPPDNVVTEPGAFCFSDGTTTTTTVSPSYTVAVIPTSATLDSGVSYQFSARTTFNGEEVDGTYDWEIVPVSAIGSSIDENGLFMAGENTADAAIEETVRVTDTAHENKTATAYVTVKPEKVTPECEVAVNPSSSTVFSRDTVILSASTPGDDCVLGEYEWSVDSAIGSTVDQGGRYTAGSNDTGSPVDDLITVVDHANDAISGTATITVESEGSGNSISIVPATLLGLRWMAWPHLVLIRGEDAGFNPRSRISFEPGDDIVHLFHCGFGDSMFAIVIIRANPQEGPVEVTVTTDGEVVRGELSIELLSAGR